MKARLVAVGERPPGWVADGFAEYRKRLSHWLPLELVEITPGLRGKGRDAVRAMQEEGQRVLAALPGTPRLWTLPPALFRALLVPARMAGVATGFSDAALARMRQDLAFDDAPARRDFGYAPRAFRPDAAMFTPPA